MPPFPTQTPAHQLTILVIEDDQDTAQLISRVLTDEGYQTLVAHDGETGLALAEANHPELIVCDIMMPNMDGYSVLRSLRGRSSTATTPFIFLTALSQRENMRQGMDLGADDYLTKPIRPRDLTKAVEIRLWREQQLQTEQIQKFAQQLVQVQEAERERTAAALQNRISQTLFGLKFSLSLIETSTGYDPQLFEDSRAQLDKLIAQVESIAQEMHPTILENLGLLPTIRWLVDQYAIDVSLTSENMDYRFAAQLEITLFRILQSALDNIQRHANAREARVRLVYSESVLEMVIEDHGSGFDLETILRSRHNTSLISMYERAALVGGQVEIVSQIGKGTRVEVRLPLSQSEATSQVRPIAQAVLNQLKQSQPAASPDNVDQEIKIAIAIEQPLQREGLRRLLENNANLRVVAEIRDLQQTTAVLEKQHPDVLIINPAGTGKKQHDVLHELATSGQNVRTLVIAARIDPEYVLDALQSGVLGYISSSVTMTDLHTAIVNVARGQMYLSPTIKQQDILAKLKPTD